MRRFAGRRIWTLTFVVVLLSGAALVAYLIRASGELERWKAARQAQGETFSLAALVSPVAPGMTMAVQQFTGAVARLQVLAVEPGGLELMRAISPGYARVLWKEETLASGGGRDQRRWEELTAQIKANESALGDLRKLVGEPLGGTANDLTQLSAPLSSLMIGKRKCAQWLAGAEVEALHRGALDEALGHLHGILALARLNEEESTLANQMMRVGIARYGLSATWEALQAPGWDDGRLVSLQKDWGQVKLLARFERTIEVERARGILFFEYARTNREGLSDLRLAMGLSSTKPLAQAFEQEVYLPVWQKTWSKGDELFFVQRLQEVLNAFRGSHASGSYAGMRAVLEAGERDRQLQRTRFDDFRHALSDVVLDNWHGVLTTVVRQELRQQIATVAIALKRHQVRHGAVPDRLSALVPEFLARLPRDLMTGGELLYERNADGSWVVYSAGENGRDEDTLGDDIVWPLTGYPERLTDPAPWQTIPREISGDGPSTELVGKLAAEMKLSLRFDPKPAAALTNHLSVRLEQSTPFEALEGIVGNQGLLMTKGAKHRLNCVIADPFPSSFYYDDVTDEPSSGEVQPLIVIDGVPLTDAIRNLARHAGINFQFDPKVTARIHSDVTLRYENVSAEEVFKQLVRERGFVLLRHKKSGIVRVTVPTAE